jgi:hypothetical protein
MSCPPGVLCFDKNMIMIIGGIFLFSFFYSIKTTPHILLNTPTIPATPVSKLIERRINEPLVPPEQTHISNAINIPTRGESPGFQQVGVLIQQGSTDKDKKILPLYGEPTYRGSNKWRYYTGTDGFQSVKLPVLNKNKNCLEEYGCDEIYEGDAINIMAYENSYVASLYKLDSPRYLPNV